jgi:methyl-accepting chemotaxis protein
MGSFGQSINLAFGACVVLMAGIGLFGAFGLSKLNSNIADSYSGNTVPINDLSDVREASLDIQLQLRQMQVLHDQGKTAPLIKEIRKDEDVINKAWNHYYPDGISSDNEREIADSIKNAFTPFKAAADGAVAALSAGNYDAATSAIEKLAVSGDAIKEALNQDAAINLAGAQEFTDDSESMFRRILWIAIALLVVGVLVGLGASAYLRRVISKPLDRAVEIANHIAGGKLANDIVVDSQGEFGQLLEALKKMDAQLSATVQGIKNSTESVAVESKEIASGNTDLSARTEERRISRTDGIQHDAINRDG